MMLPRFLLCIIITIFLTAPHPTQAGQTQEQDSQTELDENTSDENAPAVDWVSLESAGILSGSLQGALDRTAWKGAKRSEILSFLESLPDQKNGLRSVRDMQKRLLLSAIDSELIENDIPPEPGRDLLTLRLEKLMQMGLAEDAYTLYTQSISEPYGNQLAQTGILLIMRHSGLPTACLDSKVIAARWPEDAFWDRLDRICALKLGTDKAETLPEFPDSAVLQEIFHNPDYRISTAEQSSLSPLERAIAEQEGRIEAESTPQNLEPAAGAEDQDLLRENLQEPVTQAQTLAAIARMLEDDAELPDFWVTQLQNRAPENPENYMYLQALQAIRATRTKNEISNEDLMQGFQALPTWQAERIVAITEALDKNTGNTGASTVSYEKHSRLTQSEDYVIPSDGLRGMLADATARENQALVVLAAAHTLNDKSPQLYPDSVREVLESLLSVGLIGEARLIAKELLADILAEHEGD